MGEDRAEGPWSDPGVAGPPESTPKDPPPEDLAREDPPPEDLAREDPPTEPEPGLEGSLGPPAEVGEVGPTSTTTVGVEATAPDPSPADAPPATPGEPHSPIPAGGSLGGLEKFGPFPPDGALPPQPPPGSAPEAQPLPTLLPAVETLFQTEPPVPAPASPPVLPVGRILALANQKGGVGKTTTAINLGAALVERGAQVLLVDFDPQGALSVGLGLNPNALDLTIYNLLLDPSVSFQDVACRSKIEGLDLLPSNIDLAAAEILLVTEVAREQTLKRALSPVREAYNYVLIDCPPSLGLLTINALTAADGVVIPLECEYFALRGMALLIDTIRKVQTLLNPSLKIEGILATMLDSRTIHGREVLSRVGEAFGDQLFRTVIHKTIRFAEAPVAGEPILTYAGASAGAEEYRHLALELISGDHRSSKPAMPGAIHVDIR